VPLPLSRNILWLQRSALLDRDGEPLVWKDRAGQERSGSPGGAGGTAVRAQVRDGYYRRAAIAWTQWPFNVVVVHHHPRSVLKQNLFALYRGKSTLAWPRS